jgi:DHA2 family multidrug resistance protein
MTRNSKLIVFVAVLASLLEIIDISIVNVALPTMMGNLGATLEDISMVITGYAIANAVVLPLSGWLSERLGRRKYYLGCIVLFTFTSVLCGIAPNLQTLIVFRILQGLAGGALLPTSQALIYEQFPKEKAGMAGAIFGMSVMIGPTLGPVLGGYLTDNFGWRSIFNINLPLGIFALLVGLTCIHNREGALSVEEQKKAGFDGIGLGLLILGIGCLQYTLERGEADDWFTSNAIICTCLLATICLPAFVWWELKVKNPIINIRLFFDGIVSNGVWLMTMLGFFLYALVFILPVFCGQVFHYDATQIGLLFIPGSLLTAVLMPVVGRMMQRGVNSKILIFIGICSLEVCLVLCSHFSPLSSRMDILAMLFVRGFAMAFLFVPINSSILSQFKGATLGQVSGLLNLSRQLGGSMGIALVATLLSMNSHQNYLDLSTKISLLNPVVQTQYSQLVAAMSMKMREGVGMASGTQAALKALQYRIQGQAFLLSFNQLVFVIMIIFSLAYIPLYLIQFKRKVEVVDSH